MILKNTYLNFYVNKAFRRNFTTFNNYGFQHRHGIITIIIDSKQYCVNPHPGLTAGSYQYNRTYGKVRLLTSLQCHPPRKRG